MKIWKLLGILAGICTLGLAVLFLESYRELHKFRVRRIARSLPGVKGRILFLTDYHEAVGGAMNEKLLKAAAEEKPDLILIGGDMVNGNHIDEDYAPAVSLINGLAQIAPTVYAYGNHEKKMIRYSKDAGFHWADYMAALNPEVKILTNDYTDCKLKQGSIHVYGLDMDHSFFVGKDDKLTKEALDQYLGKPRRDLPVLLLAHDPGWAPAYGAWGADLILSGHYHGGIIRLPLLGGLVSPKLKPFPHFDYGVYDEGDIHMLVSSGLGQHTIPVRFNNLPEMVLLELK